MKNKYIVIAATGVLLLILVLQLLPVLPGIPQLTVLVPALITALFIPRILKKVPVKETTIVGIAVSILGILMLLAILLPLFIGI